MPPYMYNITINTYILVLCEGADGKSNVYGTKCIFKPQYSKNVI